MTDIDPIVFTYGVAAAEYLVLALVLIVAAMRNHFAHKQFRPAILALSSLSMILAVQNAMRIYSAYLRTSGKVVEFTAFLQSPWWLYTNVLATVAGAFLFFTLVIAYPASRYSTKRRHGPHPGGKTDGTD